MCRCDKTLQAAPNKQHKTKIRQGNFKNKESEMVQNNIVITLYIHMKTTFFYIQHSCQSVTVVFFHNKIIKK